MKERLFTLEEANALIPKLEVIMTKLQQRGHHLRQELNELAEQTGQAAEDLTTAQLLELRPALQPLLEELNALLAEIEACGGEFKGLDLGLVDFPAELDGTPILLCWQYGEKEIAYYHSPAAGFAGRTPLAARPARGPYLH